MAVSTKVGTTKKKTLKFGIFIFVEVLETNLRGNQQDSKCDGDFIILWKVPSHPDLVEFFLNNFTPTTGVMFSTDLHYLICST